MTTDASAERARKALNELFKRYPWLARNDTCVPGCGHLLWCDLAALRAAEQPDAQAKAAEVVARIAEVAGLRLAEQPAPEKGETKIFGLPVDKPCPSYPADAGSGEDALAVWLRQDANGWEEVSGHTEAGPRTANLERRAADEITRLTSDLSAAREQIAERDSAREILHGLLMLSQLKAERDALSQEVARLREAATKALHDTGWGLTATPCPPWVEQVRAASLARGE